MNKDENNKCRSFLRIPFIEHTGENSNRNEVSFSTRTQIRVISFQHFMSQKTHYHAYASQNSNRPISFIKKIPYVDSTFPVYFKPLWVVVGDVVGESRLHERKHTIRAKNASPENKNFEFHVNSCRTSMHSLFISFSRCNFISLFGIKT